MCGILFLLPAPMCSHRLSSLVCVHNLPVKLTSSQPSETRVPHALLHSPHVNMPLCPKAYGRLHVTPNQVTVGPCTSSSSSPTASCATYAPTDVCSPTHVLNQVCPMGLGHICIPPHAWTSHSFEFICVLTAGPSWSHHPPPHPSAPNTGTLGTLGVTCPLGLKFFPQR